MAVSPRPAREGGRQLGTRPMPIELTVDAGEEGVRLDALIAARPEVGSRTSAAHLFEGGRVRVNGRGRPKSHRVSAGERVEVDVEASRGRPVETGERAVAEASVPFAVAYEDEHVLVVDKPTGVVVHPGRGREHGTLAQALAGRVAGGPPGRRGVVHRLDRETSGLLVLARSEEAHAALTEALRRREVRREYLALVEGVPDALTGTIDAAIGRDRGDRTLVSTSTDRPRAARTRFAVREALARTALLELELETGRTHQIRAHAAAIGHPVCGDARYGGEAGGRRLGLGRQFLHATRLTLAHPATGEELALDSALPADLAAALERARAEPRAVG